MEWNIDVFVRVEYLSILQVVIVDGENAATENGQLEKLNKEGDEETVQMNEYDLLCLIEMFTPHNVI